MTDLNSSQLARLRRFEQLQLIDTWVECQPSAVVELTTTGDDQLRVPIAQLDSYLTGLSHGAWAAIARMGIDPPRWMRSVLSDRTPRGERGSSMPLALQLAAAVLLLIGLSVAAFGAVVLYVVGAFALSLSVCLLCARALKLSDDETPPRR